MAELITVNITRKDFLKLPMEARRRILQQEAKSLSKNIGQAAVMFDLHWEQCPRCGHWMVLVVKLRFTGVKSCYTPGCTYWEMGGEGLDDGSVPAIDGVSFEKVPIN